MHFFVEANGWLPSIAEPALVSNRSACPRRPSRSTLSRLAPQQLDLTFSEFVACYSTRHSV
jgi:hypothetical protein